MKERTLLKSHSSLQGALCKKSWFLSHPTRQILKAFGWRPTRPSIQKYLTSWGSHTRIYFLANGTLNVPRSCSQSKTDPSINNQDWASTAYQKGLVVKSVNVHPTPTQNSDKLKARQCRCFFSQKISHPSFRKMLFCLRSNTDADLQIRRCQDLSDDATTIHESSYL